VGFDVTDQPLIIFIFAFIRYWREKNRSTMDNASVIDRLEENL
jgi:hypothetical protein